MIRGPQQRGPVRLVACEESTLQRTSSLGYGLIIVVLGMPFAAIGLAWAAYYVVRGLGVVALIWKAVLT